MDSTRYIVIFVTILTVVVAVGLTGLRQATASKAAENEEIFNKRAILSSVEDYLPNGQKVSDLSDAEVLNLFQEMEQYAVNTQGEVVEGLKAEDINMEKQFKKPESERELPLFVYEHEGEKYYIIAVRGSGLWDAIWGNIAFKNDLNTIVGASFDHQGETPGLGAEIKDNPSWSAQFKGKEVYENGEYVFEVRKGGAKDPDHEVDGLSGATITANGVDAMLEKGINDYYKPYLEKLRSSGGVQGMLINN